MNLYRRQRVLPPLAFKLLRLLVLLPLMFASCGSVFQGPVLGSIQLERPADAGDAVVFLRCSGSGFHGDITTDAEDTRVAPNGHFRFLGSLTFPTTERCRIEVRHPRYQSAQVALEDGLIQKLEPITLISWDELFEAGPGYEINPGSHRPWPETEVYRHVSDTLFWLRTFAASDQRLMARYVPDIHAIYRQAYERIPPGNRQLREMLRLIGMIEEITAYPYPFTEYLQAVKAGDAQKVQAFIDGGVLRETQYRGQSSTLAIAARQGHLEVIDVLLANDEPLNIPGCGAPLLAAIRENQWPAALKLIRVGADIEVSCSDRRVVGDALTDFARHNRLDLLAQFLDAGVPVDTRNSRNTTALAEAAAGGHIEPVKALLRAGADPNVDTAEKVRLIDDAAAKGYLDIEQELRLAMAAGQDALPPGQVAGEVFSLPWRRGSPSNYRMHSNYGQINDMVADPKTPGVLWLATAGGLLRVEPESGAQRAWARVNGLPAGKVQDLWFDSSGNYLWLATGAGLARLPLDELERVETVGSGEPHSSYASGFLRRERSGAVWYWGDGQLYRLEAESSEARRYAFPQDIFAAVAIPGSADFFISDNTSLWRFDATTGQRQLVVDNQTLASHAGQAPAGQPQPRSLSLDSANGVLWIGTHAHGVFRLDIASNLISRPALTTEQITQCARDTVSNHMYGKAVHVGGRTFAQLERCFGQIGDDNRFQVMPEHIDADPVVDAADDIWLLADEQFYRLGANGETAAFQRRPDSLGNARVNAAYRVGKQLFVGVKDASLAVLDLEQRTWSQVAGVADIQRLRRVAGRDELLALGKTQYYLVDPGTLAARELLIGPSGGGPLMATQWRDLRDLEFDGETLWALRDNRQRRAGKSRVGLYRINRDGYKFYDSASGYYLGELGGVVQDPSHPGRLWLLRNRDNALVDFDKSSEESELIGTNSSQRRNNPLLTSALANPRLKTLTTGRHETLDPDAPELTWGVRSSGVYLQHGPTVLHRWPAKLPIGPIEIVRSEQTTVWIATSEGLLEFPIAETLAELRQPGPTQGKRVKRWIPPT